MAKSLRLLGLVPLLLASSAFANVIGPTTTSTPIPLTLTDWTHTLAFPKFNPALGTLTQIELNITGGLSTTITVTNNAASSSNGTAKTELALLVQDPSNLLFGNTIPYVTPPFPTTPLLDILSPAYAYNLAPGGFITSGTLTNTLSADNFYTASNILTAFTGSGNILLSAETLTGTVLANNGGNTIAGQVTTASATGTITYTYTPIPEPSALALMGIGGLAFWRRRKV